jgi:hypothetical protein
MSAILPTTTTTTKPAVAIPNSRVSFDADCGLCLRRVKALLLCCRCQHNLCRDCYVFGDVDMPPGPRNGAYKPKSLCSNCVQEVHGLEFKTYSIFCGLLACVCVPTVGVLCGLVLA